MAGPPGVVGPLRVGESRLHPGRCGLAMGVPCCNGGGAARCGMSNDIDGRIDTWLARCADIERDPFEGMAAAGLLALAPDYATIARTKAALVERTGLPGVAGVWGGRQMVGRWFIAGFGDASQRSAWLGRAASVAISEPRVGAHPKLLTTRAEPDGDGFVITGEKAWVSNGPSAEVFIVLAITGEQDGRKRYSAFLVPRDAGGVGLKEMPAFHALRPSQHCGLVLKGVRVGRAAMLGPDGTAYRRWRCRSAMSKTPSALFPCWAPSGFCGHGWLGTIAATRRRCRSVR